MGAGYMNSGINWSVVRSMVTAWFLTLPITALLSAGVYELISHLFGAT
jgi:PiT family inorganic phosphate transporter